MEETMVQAPKMHAAGSHKLWSFQANNIVNLSGILERNILFKPEHRVPGRGDYCC
jgi:hypothetical protein